MQSPAAIPEPIIQFIIDLAHNLRELGQSAGFLNFVYFLWALFVVLLGVIIYVVILTMRQQKNERLNYYANAGKKESEPVSIIRKRSSDWQEIVQHLKSESEADWKIAILEADSILSSLTEDLGYPGENLGERLKSVEKGEMRSLESAWTAHKMRNRIAHEGNSFKISRRELGETLANFEVVFREFNYI
ncbi:MAG: hypothetical protein AAB590_02525 [Patescibacteria group bacterium]